MNALPRRFDVILGPYAINEYGSSPQQVSKDEHKITVIRPMFAFMVGGPKFIANSLVHYLGRNHIWQHFSKCLTMTSHGRHRRSNHRQLNWMPNSLFRLRTSIVVLVVLGEENPQQTTMPTFSCAVFSFVIFQARYIDSTTTSEIIQFTIGDIHPSHHGHTSQCHRDERSTHIASYHVNRSSHSWDKAILNFDHENPSSSSWMWSKAERIRIWSNIQSICFLSSHQSNQQFLRQSYFKFWLKNPRSRSWVKSKVKVT